MPLSILDAGAEWIWELSGDHFVRTEQVLDVVHAAEYLAELARAGFGGTEADRPWLDGTRRALVADVRAGVCDLAAREASAVPDREALDVAFPAVANFLARQRERLP